MSIRHVVSVSGGKDSTATLLLALQRFGRARIVPIFCDTGNEHEEVYSYLDYLEQALDIKIERLRANFDAEIAAKRMFIARDRRIGRKYDTVPVFDVDGNPVFKRDRRGNIITRTFLRSGQQVTEPVQKTRKIGGGRRVRWSNKAKRLTLAVLHPTGNPYLDLCLWKGRFPSRKAQFCTEQLKTRPAVEFQLALRDAGHTVVSWQGIRRDESQNRRNSKKFECLGGGIYIYRPIVDWTAQQTIDFALAHSIRPNPLYLQGMSRVGCMPCINVNKAELREIALRFPEHIARIAEWEQQVAAASKRGAATFIPAPGIRPEQAANHSIHHVVQWTQTSRGGRQFDLLAALAEPSACSSSYGLCE